MRLRPRTIPNLLWSPDPHRVRQMVEHSLALAVAFAVPTWLVAVDPTLLIAHATACVVPSTVFWVARFNKVLRHRDLDETFWISLLFGTLNSATSLALALLFEHGALAAAAGFLGGFLVGGALLGGPFGIIVGDALSRVKRTLRGWAQDGYPSGILSPLRLLSWALVILSLVTAALSLVRPSPPLVVLCRACLFSLTWVVTLISFAAHFWSVRWLALVRRSDDRWDSRSAFRIDKDGDHEVIVLSRSPGGQSADAGPFRLRLYREILGRVPAQLHRHLALSALCLALTSLVLTTALLISCC